MRTPAPLAVAALLLAGCSSESGTTSLSSPTALSSPTPGPVVSTAPASIATPSRTPSPSASPAARRTPSPTPSPTRSRTPSPKPSPTPSPTRVPKTYPISEVAVDRFSPDTVTLRRGDSVLVTNKDNADHTFTISSLGKDSGNMSPGDTYRLTFNTTGTFEFVCTYHELVGMDGTVTVTR